MTSSDFNMLRLEAPRDLLQITSGTPNPEQAVELANPAVWVRTLVHQQRQAEDDLRRLTELCGDSYNRTDRRTQEIERAYQTLAEGTRYVYDRVNANEKIAEEWIRSELSSAANAYQSLASNIWQAILEHIDEANERQICQATQLARVNDALSFLAEANTARNQHLANFQGNVELWAAEHQARVVTLENQLREARAEIQRVATRIPLPATPPVPPTWRSPVRQTSTSAPSAHSPPALGSPLRLNPGPALRRQRPPAIPTTPEMRQRLEQLKSHIPPQPPNLGTITGQGGNPPSTPPGSAAGPPSGPPSGPPRPPFRRPRSPTPPRNSAPTITTRDLIQLVAEGVAQATQRTTADPNRVRTSRLKMENPETFDGKPTTPFNNWWKTVTKYLSFYPETSDQQKIVWVGTLLTGTAKAWDLHRYDTLDENDTWANYSAAIRTEYYDIREAASAQLKLSQLRYNGDIRAYMTEFRALNNLARASGESLQEKIDLAMPEAVIDMRFAHYLGEFADDEGFLHATYQAALQVERKKALKQAKEQMKGHTATMGTNKTDKREDRKNDAKANPRAKETNQRGNTPNAKTPWFGKKDTWSTPDEAMKGVPAAEKEEYRQDRDGCWRCGRPGHKTFECLSFQTRKGTKLPPAPWKTAAVSTLTGKRDRENDTEEPAAKQQKVAAVETMEVDTTPMWESEDSDF